MQDDALATARLLLERHGLRAAAVAQEHAAEAQLAGDTNGLTRWRSVAVAIGEIRSTAAKTPAAATRHTNDGGVPRSRLR